MLKVSIEHDVGSVDNYLIILVGLDGFFKVEEFVEIDFGFNLILFNLIVDNVVHHICSFQVQPKTACLTHLCRLNINVTPFVKRTSQ